MENNLQYLIDTFQEQHDIRFVPSVLIGGGYMFRVTVIANNTVYSSKADSYIQALDKTVLTIKNAQ